MPALNVIAPAVLAVQMINVADRFHKPSITPAWEVEYVDLAKDNRQRRMRRVFRAVDKHAAKYMFLQWRQEQYVQYSKNYKMIGTASEVLARPTADSIRSLDTPRYIKPVKKATRANA